MTTITIPRALLEQALEVIVANTTGKEYLEDAIRAELAKPVEQAEPVAWMDDFGNALPIGARKGDGSWVERNWKPLYLHPPTPAWHNAPEAPALKAERVEPITLDQFRAIAHRTATTYRHRSDPEKSSYAFVDGSSLDDFWRKVCEAIQPTSAWNDAPEAIALKAERDAAMKDAERYRWLRDATPWTAISAFDMTRVAFRLASKLSEEAEPDSGVELDAAIDAAIAKAEGKNHERT